MPFFWKKANIAIAFRYLFFSEKNAGKTIP